MTQSRKIADLHSGAPDDPGLMTWKESLDSHFNQNGLADSACVGEPCMCRADSYTFMYSLSNTCG